MEHKIIVILIVCGGGIVLHDILISSGGRSMDVLSESSNTKLYKC